MVFDFIYSSNILNKLLTFDVISFILFVIFLITFLIIKRKNLELQKVLFPFVYMLLFKTNIGLKFMNKVANKYREQVKLFGYCSIGIGFIGMIFISINILIMLFLFIFRPDSPVAQGVGFVLPFTNVMGIGYLPFWHFFISIFVIMIIHEFAHGVVARAHNVEVKSSGFAVLGLLLPIFPAAFVEPNEEKLKKQSDIVQYSIYGAGPFINIAFAMILLIIFPYVAPTLAGLNAGTAPFENHISEPIGFSYKLTNNTLPAALSGMENQSIITSINGIDVNTFTDFQLEMFKVRVGENVTIGSNNNTYFVSTVPNPNNNKIALVGINPIQNERQLKSNISQFWGNAFYWIKDLIKWLFLFNFLVGLFNLLPLIIVDGGRMFQLAISKTIKNKNIGKKIVIYIALLFLGILLFGIFKYYGSMLFSWIQSLI